MEAKPILVGVARALREQGLEAVLIGNSAAAVQGAPVTTMDIDFLIRKTPDQHHETEAARCCEGPNGRQTTSCASRLTTVPTQAGLRSWLT
jgi:hypothetical protein